MIQSRTELASADFASSASAELASPFSDEREPEQFDDGPEWSDEDPQFDHEEEGLWQADVEATATLAAAGSSQIMRAVGPTLSSTIAAWP